MSESNDSKKIASLEFSPLDETKFLDFIDVTISCATEDVLIYYTLDNSTPSESSNLYSDPIHIEQDTTIKAIAKKEGMKDSDIVSASYLKASSPTEIIEDADKKIAEAKEALDNAMSTAGTGCCKLSYEKGEYTSKNFQEIAEEEAVKINDCLDSINKIIENKKNAVRNIAAQFPLAGNANLAADITRTLAKIVSGFETAGISVSYDISGTIVITNSKATITLDSGGNINIVAPGSIKIESAGDISLISPFINMTGTVTMLDPSGMLTAAGIIEKIGPG